MLLDENRFGGVCIVLETQDEVFMMRNILQSYNYSIDGTLRQPISQDVIDDLSAEGFKWGI